MFGGVDSCRKQYGTLKDGNLPSIRDYTTHLMDGTTAPSTIGPLLVQRTGKSLMSLWEGVASGQPGGRVPFHRLPERLAANGTGVLAPREIGELQRLLKPARDGTVGFEEWAVGFKLTGIPSEFAPPQANGPPTAGLSMAQHSTRVEHIPSMRSDAMPPPVPLQAPSQQWPGGFQQVSMQQEYIDRLHESGDGSNVPPRNTPFATEATPPLPVHAVPPSPTFAQTTHIPPFAVNGVYAVDASPRPPSSYSGRPAAMTAPFATEQTGTFPTDRPSPDSRVAPYATAYDSRGHGPRATGYR